MLLRFFTLLAFSGFFSVTFAQNLQPCGVDHLMDSENKTRMLRNRAAYSIADLDEIRAQRSIVYIPVTIHLCGNENGAGFASPGNAMKMICKLNEGFADQNIQFYLNDIRFIYNNAIYADAYDWSSMSLMENYKVPNNLNIFVNAQVSSPVAGYYSPSHDFVFIQNAYANAHSTTITHEVGHFFTLPHTFYGWEGENAPANYSNSPAPTTINGEQVEYVARTNCSFAADGFCDTDADYISFRFSCPSTWLVQDPSGAVINPDPAFYMSYSSDACMSTFSLEQKNAMLADIAGRNWLSLSGPAQSDTFSAAFIAPVFPGNLDTVSTNTGSYLEFEWDTTGASTATDWLFLLERTVMGVSVSNAYQTSVSGTNKVNVPLSSLMSERDYRWSVHPYSDGYTCADRSNYFYFHTATISGIEKTEKVEAASFLLYPNPSNSGNVQAVFNLEQATTAELQVFSIEGRLLTQISNLSLQGGSENFSLDLSMLGTGLYLVVLHTDKGIYRQKLVINK